MAGNLWFLIVLLVGIAAVLNERALLMPAFLLASALVVGNWWSTRVIRSLRVRRTFTDRAFINDKVVVKVDVVNTSLLPVVWLRVHDSMPSELGPHAFNQAISLKPRQSQQFEYVVQTNRRGFYRIGPLALQSGDVLGLSRTTSAEAAGKAPLVVYPRIVPLGRLPIPSRMPLGALRQRQPLFEDPSLPRGKRDYAVGDSLRRVDWKASAATGRLQVKLFEPSIALETMIFASLNLNDYDRTTRLDSTELAIVVAASIANSLVEQKQSVGLATNGVLHTQMLQPDSPIPRASNEVDPGQQRAPARTICPRKGRGHFMRLLEVLAGVKAIETEPIAALIKREYGHLAWGTTIIVITGKADDALFDELFRAQRAGLSPVLVLCGSGVPVQPIRRKAEAFSIPVRYIRTERDVRRLTMV